MKLYKKEIDTRIMMNKQEFLVLFEKLPLTDEEKETLSTEYFATYIMFLEANVEPTAAWLATKNMFVLRIKKDRIEKGKTKKI